MEGNGTHVPPSCRRRLLILTKIVYLVFMAGGNDPLVSLQQKFLSEPDAANAINGIVRALAVTKYLGLARFEILQDDKVIMSSLVTFSDDFPNGNWSTVHDC